MPEERPKARTGLFRFNTKIKSPQPCVCRYCHPEQYPELPQREDESRTS